ncbi:LysR family transcriptional regulator [Sporolactobacillus sp. CPB3-1]|uniref:LysR family transcriptional regulator n=1 Tax=Sporolactobacillus mangiferae TaxID=2940498 RepID=A0ABT0MEE7_9BACL|nr:LysR family transcriptional regulator [Sporolactobacillus mangiferae]MCL1632644.1 LysR family transcriptional regulator [Sporolactobacillus mangiferae]
MTIDQLKTFLMVAKCLSYHAASRQLFLSQPSVTSRIQALERELNVTLFDRSNQHVRLTEEGRKMVPIAKRMVNMYNRARATLSPAPLSKQRPIKSDKKTND